MAMEACIEGDKGRMCVDIEKMLEERRIKSGSKDKLLPH
jgi:hypothetical protein